MSRKKKVDGKKKTKGNVNQNVKQDTKDTKQTNKGPKQKDK